MIEETLCPTCGARMISRKNARTGQRFWGCSAFPVCRGTRDTDGEARGAQEQEDRLPSDRAHTNDRRRWEQP